MIRELKRLAQRLAPTVMVGKKGLSNEVFRSLNDELERRELVKLKFSAFKEDKKELAAKLANDTSSQIVSRVGNVAVFFRRNSEPEKRKISLPD